MEVDILPFNDDYIDISPTEERYKLGYCHCCNIMRKGSHMKTKESTALNKYGYKLKF